MMKGKILYENEFTATFLVKVEDKSYSIFDSFQVNSFELGDNIFGPLNRTGTAELINASTLRTQKVIIRHIACDLETAMEIMQDH